MFLFHIAAFLILIICISWKFRIRLVEAFPVGCSVLVLFLYVLSFFRILSFSDYAAVAIVAAVLVYAVIAGRKGKVNGRNRQNVFRFAMQELLSPSALTALAMTAIVTACVSAKLVSWWDDYNFWATDVKALFYLDGFAGRYGNVAAEFGDYPPGTQMMKWWFLHFSPKEFKEGLMFAGYYFMNLSFLFPLLRRLKRRNILTMAASAAALWLFPSAAEVFWCDGCCADLTMALVYGNFLAAAADWKRHGQPFYYIRQALFLMVLVLIKNTGFIWVAFGLLFTYGYHFLRHKMEDTEKVERRKDRRALFLVTLLPVLTEISWLGFCLMNRRVAKLTGTAIQMATGGMNIPDYHEGMVKAFAEAFVKWPLHRWNTIAVDLSPLSLYLLLLLFAFVLCKCHVLDKRTAVYTGGFLAATGIVFYGINLVSHLTIFVVETQYLEPFGMVSSIERYGAPFAIGGLYLLAFYVLEECRKKIGLVLCMLFVFLTADYGSAYRALYGYRSGTEEIMAEREAIIDEKGEKFLEAVEAGQGKPIGGSMGKPIGRVLYLRDISDISWVRNTYLGFEASPVSVMHGNIDASVWTGQDIVNALRDAHADFLYVDEIEGDKEALFDGLLEEGEFRYGCLYRVEDGYGRLYQAEGCLAQSGTAGP